MTIIPERYHADTEQNKLGIAVLISDRADFRSRKGICDKKKKGITKW